MSFALNLFWPHYLRLDWTWMIETRNLVWRINTKIAAFAGLDWFCYFISKLSRALWQFFLIISNPHWFNWYINSNYIIDKLCVSCINVFPYYLKSISKHFSAIICVLISFFVRIITLFNTITAYSSKPLCTTMNCLLHLKYLTKM